MALPLVSACVVGATVAAAAIFLPGWRSHFPYSQRVCSIRQQVCAMLSSVPTAYFCLAFSLGILAYKSSSLRSSSRSNIVWRFRQHELFASHAANRAAKRCLSAALLAAALRRVRKSSFFLPVYASAVVLPCVDCRLFVSHCARLHSTHLCCASYFANVDTFNPKSCVLVTNELYPLFPISMTSLCRYFSLLAACLTLSKWKFIVNTCLCFLSISTSIEC